MGVARFTIWALIAVMAASPAIAQSSGFDTTLSDQLFAVQGQQVGDWNASGLNITGNLSMTQPLSISPISNFGGTAPACTSAVQGALLYYPVVGSTPGYVKYCHVPYGASVGAWIVSGQTFFNPRCGGQLCYWGYKGVQDAAGLANMNAFCAQNGYSVATQSANGGGGCNGCTYYSWSGSAWGGGSGCNGCNPAVAVTCQ